MTRVAALRSAGVFILASVALAGATLLPPLPGMARAADRRADGTDPDRLTSDYRDAYHRGAFARAESLAARQLEIRQARLGPAHEDVAASLMALAEYRAALGEDERAESALRRALAIRVAALGDRHPDVARTQRELARALIQSRHLIEADTLSRGAREIQRATLGENHPETMVTTSLLGRITAERGRLVDGEKLLRQAADGLRARPGDSEDLRLQRAAADLEHARALANLSRYVEAEPIAAQALMVRRDIYGERHPDYAHALAALASMANARDEFARAVDLEKQAYQILRDALGENNRVVLDRMGGVASLMTGVFQTPERKPSILAAEEWYHRAEPLARRVFGAQHPVYGDLLAGLGWNLVLQNRGAEAESVLAIAQAIREAAGGADDNVASNILGYRARLAYQQNQPAKAEALLRKRALYVLREKGTINRTYLSMIEGIGLMRGAQGDFAGAEEDLGRAADIYERVRLRAGQGGARASFWNSPYERLALARMELGREADAWTAAERLRGLAISDMLMVTGMRSMSPIEKARQDSLVAVLGDLENRLAAARGAAARDSLARREADALGAELLSAETAWNTLQAEIDEAQTANESRTYSLDRVQRSLNATTAIVGWIESEFVMGKGVAWGYVIRDRGPVHWVRLDTRSAKAWSRSRGRQLRDWLTGPSGSSLGLAPADTAGQARTFWDQQFAPLLPHLEGVHNLVFLPASVTMRGLPLEAMRDPQGRFLSDLYSTTYALSSTVHAWLNERTRTDRAIRRGLLVGDPPFREEHLLAMTRGEESPADSTLSEGDMHRVLRGERDGMGKLPRLRWSRREIDGVAAALRQSDRLVGSEASERGIVHLVRERRLNQYDVLHFATHAITSDQRPQESALVLSQVGLAAAADTSAGNRALDGLVSATEVMREWSLDADLVVLSACKTAQGRTTSEGTFGLSQAFLRAGARAVLVSLWSVDDEATAQLMKRFYTLWLGSERAKGRPVLAKAEALREAKQWLRDSKDPAGRQRFEHPYYWAGFVLIGDGR